MATIPLLQVERLTIGFGREKPVVHEVSFEVMPGETVGIVGESGSGKTMTALAVLRLLPPGGRIVEGRILFDGKPLHQFSEAQMRQVRGGDISMVFQDPFTCLNPVMRVGDQVAEAARLHRGRTEGDPYALALQMLRAVHLPDPERIARRYPHELSGGQRQRVMIAMAFICHPRLLIADEPTTALDVTVQLQILHLMQEIQRQQGTAVLLITHDLGVVAYTCDRVLVMHEGRVVESGSVDEVLERPRHPYTRRLLEALA
ncbi:MAG: ABC transporter ATP-binding protein [bacterium]|nr:ABC transporter ATP-binding protein [bacterium]MCS7309815.1 ABC transporter ATP-binding protein [Armatimonadota bacterium]